MTPESLLAEALHQECAAIWPEGGVITRHGPEHHDDDALDLLAHQPLFDALTRGLAPDRTAAPPEHPDNGHPHHFTCIGCGVDAPPDRTVALMEALDIMLGLQYEHDINCGIDPLGQSLGCTCGVQHSIERVLDIRLAATPEPALTRGLAPDRTAALVALGERWDREIGGHRQVDDPWNRGLADGMSICAADVRHLLAATPEPAPVADCDGCGRQECPCNTPTPPTEATR